MERILDQLTAHAKAASDNALLRDTITIIRHIQQRPDGPYSVSWDILYKNFQALQESGLWEHSAENDELLDALRVLLTSPLAKPVGHPSFGNIVIPPVQNVPSQLVSSRDHLALPTELVDILNNAYFLHILVTDSAQVLPPGKSLLSVMSHTRITPETNTKPTLQNTVEDIVHKAFWDEAVNTLSNPEPSAQLPRLKLLYGDLHVALSPLLPSGHPILVTLSSPLSPTSSPLNSALVHLRAILACLHERCAPVRDSEIGALQGPLIVPPTRTSGLATLIAETIGSILRISKIMKDDLSQFFIGNMTERQLRSLVEKEARTIERDAVTDVWRRERIMQEWMSWLDKLQSPAHLRSISADSRFLWIVRVVQALGSSLPVTCPLPSRTVQISPTTSFKHDSNERIESSALDNNRLPAVFFLSVPTLLNVQNYLQALVIAASLRTLARLPSPTRASHSNSDPPNLDIFTSRVWTLLRAEINGEPGASDTRLINLADEVVRAREQAATTTASGPASGVLTREIEVMLRAAVNRTLRPDDPVYKLLQHRLLTELCNVLVKRRRDVAQDVAPTILRAGRDGQPAGKRPKLVLDLEDMDTSQNPPRSLPPMVIDIKGFEDPVLSQATKEVFEQVDKCLWWVESVWDDVARSADARNSLLQDMN